MAMRGRRCVNVAVRDAWVAARVGVGDGAVCRERATGHVAFARRLNGCCKMLHRHRHCWATTVRLASGQDRRCWRSVGRSGRGKALDVRSSGGLRRPSSCSQAVAEAV